MSTYVLSMLYTGCSGHMCTSSYHIMKDTVLREIFSAISPLTCKVYDCQAHAFKLYNATLLLVTTPAFVVGILASCIIMLMNLSANNLNGIKDRKEIVTCSKCCHKCSKLCFFVHFFVQTSSIPTAGEDYLEVTPQIVQFPISFERAEGRWCVTLQIIDDLDYEGELPESFVISLSVSDAAVIMNQASTTVSILDDEGIHLITVMYCY